MWDREEGGRRKENLNLLEFVSVKVKQYISSSLSQASGNTCALMFDPHN